MKTRNIPIGDYIQRLQEEAIQALLRSKIFPKRKDKIYWEDTFSAKREKIERMCERNGVDHIFNNEEIWNTIKNKVVPPTGLPNFTYRNELQRLGNGYYPGLQELDERYYFNVDSEVVHEGKIYTIQTVEGDTAVLLGKTNSEIKRAPKNELRRLVILEDE